jgi:hypothetical protein
MKTTISHSQDPDLQKAPQALLRAAENARLLAERTGTPFIVRKSATSSCGKTAEQETANITTA